MPPKYLECSLAVATDFLEVPALKYPQIREIRKHVYLSSLLSYLILTETFPHSKETLVSLPWRRECLQSGDLQQFQSVLTCDTATKARACLLVCFWLNSETQNGGHLYGQHVDCRYNNIDSNDTKNAMRHEGYARLNHGYRNWIV